jgi:Fur family transcriptional regulator, zinc uptake regulator
MTSADAVRFPEPDHNHETCLADTVARAEAVFQGRGLRLTPLRRQVLEEVAGSHAAVGAYEVLERMARKSGRRMAPISVYRALDSLVEAGVVHRLESRNAFFACHSAHGGRRQVVLACQRCGAVAEVAASDVFDAIATAAHHVGFTVGRAMVEVVGDCGHCAATKA